MSLVTVMRHCEDGHKCTNKSQCVNNKFINLGYNCDCDEKNLTPSYAELQCVHHQGNTEYCSTPSDSNVNSYSPVSFCANMGTCRAKISPDQP